MAVDSATFIQQFPEFREAQAVEPEFFSRCLRTAMSQCSAEVYADAYQDAVFLLAAHIATQSPFGENLRLKSDATQSTYWMLYKQLQSSRGSRVGICGGTPDGW